MAAQGPRTRSAEVEWVAFVAHSTSGDMAAAQPVSPANRVRQVPLRHLLARGLLHLMPRFGGSCRRIAPRVTGSVIARVHVARVQRHAAQQMITPEGHQPPGGGHVRPACPHQAHDDCGGWMPARGSSACLVGIIVATSSVASTSTARAGFGRVPEQDRGGAPDRLGGSTKISSPQRQHEAARDAGEEPSSA